MPCERHDAWRVGMRSIEGKGKGETPMGGMWTRRALLKAGAVGIGLGAAPAFIRHAGASTPRKVAFTLPWLFVGGHAFEFVAHKKYWHERGLDVEITRGRGSAAACKDISTGTVLFGEASYSVMVNGVA